MDRLVSIIIPTKNSAKAIDKCLRSIDDQSYKNIEIIVVDAFSNDHTTKIAKIYGARTIVGCYNKPEARNIGFLNSIGDIIMFADSDFIFSQTVVEEIVEKIRNYDAVIIPEKILGSSFINKIRNLEKETYIGENTIEAARVYRRDIIDKIGLFDKNIIGPDEHDLYARIVEIDGKIGRILSYVYTDEFSLLKILKKKFNYGRYWRLYSRNHKNTSKHQIYFRNRIEKLFMAIHKNPLLGSILFLIKGLEYILFLSGIFFSYFDRQIIRLESNIAKKYNMEAEFYEQDMYHSSIGAEYVNNTEKNAVISIITKDIDNIKNSNILDVGAGNGRWSKEFLNLGLKVTALDISEKMCEKLREYIDDKNFDVNYGTIEATKFQDRTFDIIFSFRSFKYIYDDEKALFEINRILKDNGIFIVEISNYLNPFYFPLYFLSPFIRYLIKKDIIEYMCMIKMYSLKFSKEIEENGFKTMNMYPLFFFSHGVFAKIKNDNILKIISKIDKTFCNALTARSLIFVLKKDVKYEK